MAVIANNDTSAEEAKLRIIESIHNQDKTAASLVCQLRNYGTTSMMKDVLGVVATLGKVNDDNLSRSVFTFVLHEFHAPVGVNLLHMICLFVHV